MKDKIKTISTIFLFTTVMLTALSGCSNSNDYEIYASIHGNVTDYTDGKPLENATVVLSPVGITKQTDATGYYQFENLEIQQYTITVQKNDYQPNRKTISGMSGEDLQVDIQLTPIPQ